MLVVTTPLVPKILCSMTSVACRAWIRRMSSQAKVRADLASFPGGRSRSCGIVGMPNVGKVRQSFIERE